MESDHEFRGIIEEEVPAMPEREPRLTMAVFGGSFDPIHNGHLFLAGTLLREHLADEVMLVPASHPPHKENSSLAPSQDRMAMLELAVESHPNLSISDIELNRSEDPSYTIDTMETLSRLFSEHNLRFVLGMDSLRQLHLWHRAGELVNRFDFIIYPRPGLRVPSHAELNPHFGPRNARKLLNSIVNLPENPISATLVRNTIGQNGSLCGLVDGRVINYITQRELYKKSMPDTENQE